MKKFLVLSLSDVIFIMLINVKMPTIVGILTFISMINFMFIWVEHEKGFRISGPASLNLEDWHAAWIAALFSTLIWIHAYNWHAAG